MSWRDSWEEYLAGFPARNKLFEKRLYAAGVLPRDLKEGLSKAILGARHMPISNDHADGAVISRLDEETIRLLNEQHVYRELDSATTEALERALEYVSPDIAALLNSPWRVLNVRSWTTETLADMGPNRWHVDGDVPGLLKMMIYSSDAGGIQLMTDDGVKEFGGCWVIFYNSVVKHQGISGGQRVATEVTIAPSFEFELTPIACGLAARHSLTP